MCYPCPRSELLPMSPVAQGGNVTLDRLVPPHPTCFASLASRPLPAGERSSKRRALADQRPPSLQRRQRAHPGDERVEIRLGELAEVDVARHRRLEGAAVASDPLRERALDLVVAPLADAGGGMRRDVRRARRAPRVLEFISSPAPPVHV